VVKERSAEVVELTSAEEGRREFAKKFVESDKDLQKRAKVLFAFSKKDAELFASFRDKKQLETQRLVDKLVQERKDELEAIDFGRLSIKGKRDYLARAEEDEDDAEDSENADEIEDEVDPF